MNGIPRLLRTVSHLRIRQAAYQILRRLHSPRWRELRAPEGSAPLKMAEWIAKPVSLRGGEFEFLNIRAPFRSWQDVSNGMLWAYNLNYMDWLCQPGARFGECAGWAEHFIDGLPCNSVGLQPYPTALRGVNWIKFISACGGSLDGSRRRRWDDSLYSQYARLARRPEYHLSGNHLLEDAFSLFIAALYFRDKGFYRRASGLLREELDGQILPDGAHYEQSPMYHCILLDRLLDCCNCSMNNAVFGGQEEMTDYLAGKARLMLGHLESIVWADKSVPLLNDSAYGTAPEPADIFGYARRLGLEWAALPLAECGCRKFADGRFEAVADAGNVTASCQPGHTHADTFSFELRAGGRPFIVDTGTSTYEKNARRQYERSTAAHNTVSVGGRDSSEVWGGFRVGRRARVKILADAPGHLAARHDGFGSGCPHTREFALQDGIFSVRDTLPAGCRGVSYLHFAPEVTVSGWDGGRIQTDMAEILISGAQGVEIADGYAAREYNRLQQVKTARILFRGSMMFAIK